MTKSPIFKVFIAIILAIIAGYFAGKEAAIAGIAYVRIFDLIGQLFLNALTLVVVPLVASSIITGVARIGAEKSFAKLGGRTFFFFVLTVILASFVGFLVITIANPGAIFGADVKDILTNGNFDILAAKTSSGVFNNVENLLFRLIPSNILHVAATGQMLGLIFFSVLFGFFSSRIDSPLSQVMVNFWQAAFEIMMKMTQVVMRALPIGVFGLMAKVVATTGFEVIKPIAFFFVLVILALAIFTFVVLPLLIKFVGGVSPLKHFKDVAPALLTAFTTSSTAATLPITLECMEKRAKIPNRICSFTLPLGTSINLTGTALYSIASVIFIAQVYGMEMNVSNLTTILLMGSFTGLGMVAGIPSGSIISIMIILQTVGLPKEGVVLIMAVERILDMCRTTVSVFGNTCCCLLVHKT